ncbi:MAG TPA: preprotein translocase subunit SecY [Streptosporangiaceae bacterium]|nr:preprotein translocase, SecY subunit [Actinomycetes bacterium]HXA61241.1 preprotein translocase subunit SecY [Streptosporangiaceae bacterium]
MLTAFIRAFKTPDLRKKLLFTLFIILIFRLGAQLPTPGVSVKAIKACTDIANNGSQASVYQLVNLFSGGALLKLSVFALGIMPYITASIILQLLTVVIPRLETLKKEGQSGTTKITQYTRYLTIGLAILQSTGIVAMASTGNLFQGCTTPLLYNTKIFTIVTMVVIMTAGTAVIMWLGELVTDKGVGNGMSILIFTQVVAVFPQEFANIYTAKGGFAFTMVIVVGLAIVAGVVFVEQAQRRIPVQYAKRMVGRRMYGGTSTYIPLKVNQAGIIPVIFASSLMYLPALAAQLFRNNKFLNQTLAPYLQQDNAWHMAAFFGLIVFFTYFYVAITFNPTEVADNMKKYGGFIPGIRPGRPTAEYLDYVLTRITTPGALYLGMIALIPMIAFALLKAGSQFPFGGTSILIVVGVGLDTVKQIESQLQQRNYEGFLR